MIAGRPHHDLPLPPAVQVVADSGPVSVVWENELGGLTFELGDEGPAGNHRFVKWAPAGSGLDLAAEARRMDWAGRYTPVPRVLASGTDSMGAWLMTRALPGRSAVADRWKRDPATAVAAIGAGLRAFHDALPVTDCPFTWSAEGRVEEAVRRGVAESIEPGAGPRPQGVDQGDDEDQVDEGLASLAEVPPVDRLVVCHGDACAPNTLITDDGRWSGHVDLGQLGVADRWADLAVATWSLEWNYGPGWDDRLLEVYGVDPDPDRTRYYRRLWDVDP